MNSAAAMQKVQSEAATDSVFDYKAAVYSILPRIAATTHESDKQRRLADDAANALRESGLSRMITPKQFGGYEMSPSAHIWACAEIGKVCSAASWVLMVCVAHDYIIGRFPEECQREVYEGDADNLVAGSLAPAGVLTPVEGGWRLTGRWQFGSGSDHSPWFIVGSRRANPGPDDYLIHHVMVPLADVEIVDTWHTLGMRGTGSKDLVVTDAFIPAHRAVPTQPTFLGLSPHAKAPTYRLSVYSGLPAMLSGSVLGMAEGGLKAFIDATAKRVTPAGVVKAVNASMQKRVAESSAEIAAARRLLTDMCERFDKLMEIDQAPMATEDRIQMRWDAAYVVELCRRAIDRIYAASGAAGIYEGSPVYRAFRDISTACHHAVIDFDTVSGMMGQFKLTGDLGENPRAAPFA
ncbi:acyl-CoA dehydrogenase family protein [Rhodopseudomonas sp.]|uniref:acyl-CoA dehydrogenase family protein n=1 Tax=Rhodopseudomonas sp. TaxID=1078 RepID=UPI003B3B3912